MFKAFFLILLLISSIAGLIYLLRKRNGSDIRVLWYLSSLTVMITFVVAAIAISAGAIHEGKFVGESGALLSSFVGFMLDLEKDFLIVTCIAGLIMVPQFVCYVLSGLSGNAKSPMLMNASLSFLVWGITKSLVVCASILVSLYVLFLLGYLPSSGSISWFFVGAGLYFLLLAFSIISLYREGEQIARYVGEHVSFLKKMHIWFTRNETASHSEKGSDENELLDLSQSMLGVTSKIHTATQRAK